MCWPIPAVITSPPVGRQSIVMTVSLSVCLSVCLSACPRAYVCKYTSSLHRVTYLWPWLGPPSGSVVIRCILPVLWTTSYLHTVGRMQGCWCSSGTGGATRPGLAWLGRGPCLLQQAGSPLRCDVGLFIIPLLVWFPRPC